jgi:hypothetical protein
MLMPGSLSGATVASINDILLFAILISFISLDEAPFELVW